ncbi:hypothetical protein AY473_10845 [Corynebacterium diphtheriae bv. mitis]|nr:hypothetical protein AY473_10845 [Corynebacterium diphtheriae bv. mitis]
MFNVWQMNKAEKRFQYSSMNRNHFLTFWAWFGYKKLRRLSTTRWCREADGFLDAAWRLCHKVLRQPFSKTSLTSSGLAFIAFAVCHETPSFGATILQANCMET